MNIHEARAAVTKLEDELKWVRAQRDARDGLIDRLRGDLGGALRNLGDAAKEVQRLRQDNETLTKQVEDLRRAIVVYGTAALPEKIAEIERTHEEDAASTDTIYAYRHKPAHKHRGILLDAVRALTVDRDDLTAQRDALRANLDHHKAKRLEETTRADNLGIIIWDIMALFSIDQRAPDAVEQLKARAAAAKEGAESWIHDQGDVPDWNEPDLIRKDTAKP